MLPCVVDVVASFMLVIVKEKLVAHVDVYIQTRLLSFLVPTVLENTPRGERAFDIYSRYEFTWGKSKIVKPKLEQI